MVRILKDATKIYLCLQDETGLATTVPGGLGLELVARPEAEVAAYADALEAAGVDVAPVRAWLLEKADPLN